MGRPSGYDFIKGYEITHNFNEISLTRISFGSFKKIFSGTPYHTFQVHTNYK